MTTAGKLVAVAKFHRNNCYQPNFSGEYGAPGVDGLVCRSKDEEIVVSDELPAPEGINQSAPSLTFNFPTPIPINASDLYLQVVYRGPLGQETDVVAVATKDIAEPTYVGFYNTLEQSLYGNVNQGLMTFKAYLCDLAGLDYDACKHKYRYSYYLRFAPPRNFDPSNAVALFDATIAMEDVIVSRYARAAILTDKNPVTFYVLRSWAPGEVISGEQAAAVNQFDPADNSLTPTQYFQARGISGQVWFIRH